MKTSHVLLAGAGILALWLFWPRKGVPFFQLEPIVIHAGGGEGD